MKVAEEKREFFNHLAATWDKMPRSKPMEAGIRNFVQCAYLSGAKNILDVGCGTGILVPFLLNAYPRTRLILELDYAEEMLARNRAKYSDRRLVRLLGDATNLPLPDGSIDVVLCFNAAPHLGKGEAAFQDLFRVLAPGGVIAVGHLRSSIEMNQFHENLQGPIHHDYLPPARELADIFSSLGGRDVTAQEQTGWYFVRAKKPA